MSEALGAPRPLLILVSGMPGAGKTTLARELSDALHLPVVSRDLLKTGMHVTVGSEDPNETRRFAEAAFRLFYETVELHLRCGSSVIAEAAFHRLHSKAELLRLSTMASVVHLAMRAPVELAARRYLDRALAGLRHPAHDDLGHAPRIAASAPQYELDEPTPLLSIDTSTGYDPPMTAIRAFIERQRLV